MTMSENYVVLVLIYEITSGQKGDFLNFSLTYELSLYIIRKVFLYSFYQYQNHFCIMNTFCKIVKNV